MNSSTAERLGSGVAVTVMLSGAPEAGCTPDGDTGCAEADGSDAASSNGSGGRFCGGVMGGGRSGGAAFSADTLSPIRAGAGSFVIRAGAETVCGAACASATIWRDDSAALKLALACAMGM